MSTKLKFIIFIALWCCLFYEILFDKSLQGLLFSFLEQQPKLMPFLLVIMQLLFASFMLPCSPLAVFAGIFWGVKIGILYSTLSTLLSSIWCFLLSRYLFKTWFRNKISSDLVIKAQGLIKNYNWKASAFAHMNPIFPGSSLGYFFGTSDISLFFYSVGAIVGTLPLQLIMVSIGHLTYTTLNFPVDYRIVLSLIILIILFIVYKFFYNCSPPRDTSFRAREKSP